MTKQSEVTFKVLGREELLDFPNSMIANEAFAYFILAECADDARLVIADLNGDWPLVDAATMDVLEEPEWWPENNEGLHWEARFFRREEIARSMAQKVSGSLSKICPHRWERESYGVDRCKICRKGREVTERERTREMTQEAMARMKANIHSVDYQPPEKR